MVYGCALPYVWVFRTLVYGFPRDVRVLCFERYGPGLFWCTGFNLCYFVFVAATTHKINYFLYRSSEYGNK